MRASFQKKKSKIMTKRQDIISSDLSQSKSSLRDTEHQHKNIHRNIGLKKALQHLQTLLIDQKEVREDLENKITNLHQRTIQRENEFRRIIEETIPFCIKQRSANVINANLKSVHQKIMTFFDITQQYAEQHLIEQKKLLEQQMHRKIQTLTVHVEKQLQQNRRLQSLNYQKIHRQINKAISLSTTILHQNQHMGSKIKQLEFSNKIHQQQKQLLIAQILQKKNLIQKLYNHLRISYDQQDKIKEEINLIREQNKRMQEKQQKNSRIEMQGCFKTIQITKGKPRFFHTQNKIRLNQQSKDAKKTIKTQTSFMSKNLPVQHYSTIDVKAHNTFQTSVMEKQQNAIIYQLRQSLKRQKLKSSKQLKKIEYLIGYKRSIDLFLKQCYNTGNLDDLSKEKIQILLRDLREKIESDSEFKEGPKVSIQSSYKDFISQIQ